MKLTRGDTKDVLTWGAGGFAVGILYQLGCVWVKQKTNTQDLDPPTEALNEDAELFALFCQLQAYRKLNEAAFRRAVDDADRLVFLHTQLRNTEVKASLTDRPNAFLFFKNAVYNLELLFDSSFKHPMPRIPVEVHRLYLLIFASLETHWNSVLHLTQSI